ncbi:hypothetical protein HYH03_005814 [Edaphochlamys debaryana]|uniref:STAS domain-containing protein n=1 Tax=Edaphochlamys debaryana TaxID=47281 RepID=A0A835Y573_9CHLO|nr:hypothetical protein HYH03_005814 [Edaphochlamys debaryana]|eukprot:KAG2496216.1 hypothetical protein HYH03_005814 [Edaphochlamys debaryana]
MSLPRKPSALSDLIRQATNNPSDASSSVADAVPIAGPRRASRDYALLGYGAPDNGSSAQQLAEAYFPGGSSLSKAFFPKSLTAASQHGHFLLGGGTRTHVTSNDGSHQAGGTSPPGFPYGSTRGSSFATGGVAGASATTNASFLRQQSFAHGSIAEVDVEGEGDRHDGNRSVDQSNQASLAGGTGSWISWAHGRSPPTPVTGSIGGSQPTPHGHVAIHLQPHAHGVQSEPAHHQHHGGMFIAPQQGPNIAMLLQPQLGAAVAAGGAATEGVARPVVAQGPALPHVKPGRGGQSDLTEPLLGPDAGTGAEAAAGAAGTTGGASPFAREPTPHGVSVTPGQPPVPRTAGGAAGAAGGMRRTRSVLCFTPQSERHQPPPELAHKAGYLNAVVFGIINAVVSMPTLIAYAAIVFKAPVYTPYLESLCRFFFFSSAIHQLVFVFLSDLPFAIGQVQDVGLIFLSAMASDIALSVTGPDAAAVALGSSLLAMTISTALVGLGTIVVARLKLADMVSYVPLPVVGGYLGFVGYFCIAGGTALAAGVQVDTLVSWVHLCALDPLLKLLPAAATIAVLMLCVEHVSHPLALPGLLTAIPLAFHGVLWYIGWDMAKAQEAGWVMPPTEGSSQFWELWGLFNLQNGGLTKGVSLEAMAAQLPKLLGLFLVVCFGSCMDVAAIQSDMSAPLDFNLELMTVGVSNLVTGLTGAGYTGSYIFSQTVFTMRQGVFNRLNGLAVAIVELAVFALPFSVVQYMPNFFFGALLVWFGIEISRDWLILSCRKLSRAEYVLLWASFGSIMYLGLELGIAAGIVLATLYFAFQYARSQVSGLRQVAARSGRTHLYDTSSTLDILGKRMAVLRVSGYVFFGSSTGLANQVLQQAARMLQERTEEQRQHEVWAMTAEQAAKEAEAQGANGGHPSRADSGTPPVPVPPVSASAPAAIPTPTGPPPPGVSQHTHAPATRSPQKSPAGDANSLPHAHGGSSRKALDAGAGSGLDPAAGSAEDQDAAMAEYGGLPAAERHWRAAHALARAPVVLILDFGGVTGIDSTAARTFSTLVTTLASQRVHVIFANVRRPDIRQLLGANGLQLRPFVLPPAPPAPNGSNGNLGAVAGTGSAGGAGIGGAGGGAAAAASRVGSAGSVGALAAAVGLSAAGVAEGGAALSMVPAGAEEAAVQGAGAGAGKGGTQGQVTLQAVEESPLQRPSSGGCWEFGAVSSAVRCCEDAYLGLAMAVGLMPAAPAAATSLQQLLGRHLREVFSSVPSDLSGMVAALEGCLSRRQMQLGDVLYGAGAAVREVYVIEFGALVEEEHYEGGVRVASHEHGPGVVVGCLEFFLSRPAPAAVRCSSAACQVLVVGRGAVAALMAHHPRALAALEMVLLRSACMDLASAQEAAHHAAAV